MNTTAKRARDLALDRHRTQTKRLTFSIVVLAVALVLSWGTTALLYFDNWHTETPPAQQKLEVVTYGWYHYKKGWCSYSDGMPITVKQWRP